MNEKSRKDFLDLFKKSNPRQRNTTVQRVEGKASSDGTNFVKEELSFMSPDLTTRQVTFVSSRLCDCGAMLSANSPILGTCQYKSFGKECGVYLCSQCSRICERCRKRICPKHSVKVNDVYYCSGCAPFKIFGKVLKIFFRLTGKALKAFFCIGDKEKDK